MTGCAER